MHKQYTWFRISAVLSKLLKGNEKINKRKIIRE